MTVFFSGCLMFDVGVLVGSHGAEWPLALGHGIGSLIGGAFLWWLGKVVPEPV